MARRSFARSSTLGVKAAANTPTTPSLYLHLTSVGSLKFLLMMSLAHLTASTFPDKIVKENRDLPLALMALMASATPVVLSPPSSGELLGTPSF